MKEKDIIDAYLKIRKIDNTIPDEVLDFMKKSAIEMINGLDGRGKLQEGWIKKLLDLQIDKCASTACHLVTFDNNEIIPPDMFNEVLGTPYVEFEAPDRQVKSAEDVLAKHAMEHFALNSTMYAAKSDILKAMEIYAQQYK